MIKFLPFLFKFLIEGAFSYLIFYKNEDSPNTLKKSDLYNLFNFCFVYTSILSIYNYFLNNSVSNSIISSLIIFFYAVIKSKKVKVWKFFIVYSSFINIFMECINFLIFKIISIPYQVFNLPKTQDHVMFVWTLTVIINFGIFLFLYTFRFIKLEIIRKLSTYEYSWIGFCLALLCVLYMKYYVKHYCNEVENFGIILSNFLLLIIPIVLFFIGVASKMSEKKNKEQNEIDENKIHNAINSKSLDLPNDFDPEIFEYNCKLIRRKLSKFKVYESRQGFNQMVFCISIIKFMEGKKVVLFKNVYPVLSEIIKVDVKLIDTNIRNLINETWTNTDPEILQREYKRPINKDRGHPTAREFLIYIANNLEN